MAEKIAQNLKQKIETLVQEEVSAWENAEVFITERVAFLMRNVIRQARRNYYGVFNDALDPVTGRKKVFVPLTQALVEAVVKNIDLDTKDVNLRAKNPLAFSLAALARNILKNWLDENFFGEDLDVLERQVAIDGTHVWKTFEQKGKMVRRDVDLLNFYIDPGAKSIQETPAVIERALMTPKEFEAMDRWYNKQDAIASPGVHPTDTNLTATTPVSPQKYIEVFERWGTMSKAFISGREADEKEMIEGHIVVSKSGGAAYKLHFVEENKRKDSRGKIIKPYEEVWFRRVSSRWHGMGVPEMVFVLQSWLNTVVNIRINRAYVTQLGIFKLRRNSSITPQMFSRLAANGVILVDRMEDVEQMVMQESSRSSYEDENIIQSWAERVTQAFTAITGEKLPASTPATNAVLQNRNAQSAFVMAKEQLGMFLQRWLKRHAIPVIMKNIKEGDIERITGNFQELRDMDELLATKLVVNKLDEMRAQGQVVTEQQALAEVDNVMEKLRKMGKDRFVKVMRKIDLTQYDVQVYITNEEFDKAVMVQDLVASLRLAPQFADVTMRQIFDLMGLDTNQLEGRRPVPVLPPGQGGIPGVPNMQNRSPLNVPTEANAIQSANAI